MKMNNTPSLLTREESNVPDIFQDFLHATAEDINKELLTFLETWQIEIAMASPELLPLFTAFKESTAGGKRLRGALVKLGYTLAGGSDYQEVLKPAIAFELFQTAILAHDDIIDKSPLRRGKPSLYTALGGDHYAISQAICLGDLAFFKVMEVILQSNFPSHTKEQAALFLTQKIQRTIEGQMLDISLSTTRSASVHDIIHLATQKTASYTFVGPLCLGAMLGGIDQKIISNLTYFGTQLGIAYQLHDDFLGVFADEEILGKSTSSDMAEGKSTLLLSHALEHASPSQKERLTLLYGRSDLASHEAAEIREIFIGTGAVNYIQEQIHFYTNLAWESIAQITTTQENKILLQSMTDYLLERQK